MLYIVSATKAGRLNPTEIISCACIVLLSEPVLRAMCRIEESAGGLVAEHEFQDSASAEKSGFVDLHLLPAGALKWHFSGILRFSNSIIFSPQGPHDVKRLWALEGSRLELKISKNQL